MTEDVWRHNWMYSFVPATLDAYSNMQVIDIFLVGYCKNCNKTVSKLVPMGGGGSAYVADAHIPKFGCVGPES